MESPQGVDVAQLLRSAAEGSEAAWRSLVGLYARRVYALARSRLGGGPSSGEADGWMIGSDIAEEITQSVFCTVAAKLSTGEYAEKGRFESWLFRVAMNRVRDEARRRTRHAEPTDPESLARVQHDGRDTSSNSSLHPHHPGADGLDDAPEIQALRQALCTLNDADREVIELRHHAGLSFKQISEMLDEPLGTLLARHHRALRKLKDTLTESTSKPD